MISSNNRGNDGKISMTYDNFTLNIESNSRGDISGVQVSYNLKTTKQIDADIANLKMVYRGIKMTANET
ncbi:hypothetical protein ACVW0P_000415 [Mucilaginibacter sp. UYNi724]